MSFHSNPSPIRSMVGYVAPPRDAVASMTRWVTREHILAYSNVYSKYIQEIHYERPRVTKRACIRAPSSNGESHDPREARRRVTSLHTPPLSPGRPRAEGRAQQKTKEKTSNMRRLRKPTGNPPPVLPDPSRALHIGVPTIKKEEVPGMTKKRTNKKTEVQMVRCQISSVQSTESSSPPV